MPDDIEKIFKNLGIPLDYKKTCGLDEYIPKSVTFLTKQKFVELVRPNMDLIILVTPELYPFVKDIPGNRYLCEEKALPLFLKIHNLLNKKRRMISLDGNYGIHPTVIIGKNVKFGKDVVIMPYCVIGSDVEIGDRSVIQPKTTIGDKIIIGKECVIGPNVSIGEEGFRIVRDEDGIVRRMAHTGTVIIGDFVEIGSSSTINRGTFKNTILGDHVKIDDQVHIGHNIEIGENSLICASSCIGGSALIGKDCWIGIGATIRNGIKIGDRANVDINSVVVKDIPDGGHVAGFYAKHKLSWMKKEKDEIKEYGGRK